MNKTIDMTNGKIAPLIMRFAIPLLLGNIFQQLYNTVDCIIVGNYLGTEALAAIGSSTSMIVNIAIGFFSSVAIGAGVVIANFYGAKENDKVEKAIHTSILGALFVSIVFSVLGYFFSFQILKLISTPENVIVKAEQYLKIFFGGLSFLLLYNIGAEILRAVGNSKTPLKILIISSFLNIFLDLLFIVVFKFGIKGAAFATVIAEGFSCLCVYVILFKASDIYKVKLQKLTLNKEIGIRILKIGLPGGISSFLTYFSNTYMQKYVNEFGSMCMAGWSAFAKLDLLMILPMTSIAFASTTFTGQNFGAGNYERIKKGTKICLLISTIVIGIFSFLELIFARQLLGLFSKEEEVINYGLVFMKSTVPFYILCSYCMILNQTMRGFNKVLVPTLISFTGFVIFRQIYLFLISNVFLLKSEFYVALAYPLAWILLTIFQGLYYLKNARRNFIKI